MGGTLHGSVNHVPSQIPASLWQPNQQLFTWIYRFFANVMVPAGYATMVATQYGSGGTGFDYFDGASPSGENAFFVVRMNTSALRPGGGVLGAYYLLFQWADVDDFGAAPGNPGLINAGILDGVGFCAAFREDGGSPWAGSTSNDGTDTKAATVWTAGGSTLHVMVRSNSTGGAHAVNKQNTMRVADLINGYRVHILADADFVLILSASLDAGLYWISYVGPFTPMPNLVSSFPMLMLNAASPIAYPNLFGTAAGNGVNEGLIVTSDHRGNQDSVLKVDHYLNYVGGNAVIQPNPGYALTTAAFDEQSYLLYAYDSGLGEYGLCGQANDLKVGYAMETELYNHDLSRMACGDSTINTYKTTVPWGGGVLPKSTTTRDGFQF